MFYLKWMVLSPIFLVSGALYKASYKASFESVVSILFISVALFADIWYKLWEVLLIYHIISEANMAPLHYILSDFLRGFLKLHN